MYLKRVFYLYHVLNANRIKIGPRTRKLMNKFINFLSVFVQCCILYVLNMCVYIYVTSLLWEIVFDMYIDGPRTLKGSPFLGQVKKFTKLILKSCHSLFNLKEFSDAKLENKTWIKNNIDIEWYRVIYSDIEWYRVT